MYFYFLAKSKLSQVASNRKGLGTVELVIIIAVLVGLAIIFRSAIMEFLTRILNSIFANEGDITGKMEYNAPTAVSKP